MLSSVVAAILIGGLCVPGGFDINTASIDELSLMEGITDAQASALYEYIVITGGLANIYEVLDVPGFTTTELEWLQSNCVVVPPSDGKISSQVLEIMEQLATEDGPGDAAVDVWENYLIRPLPINYATSWDLRNLSRVSLIDAVAVERRLRTVGPVSSTRSLRNIENISYYGYRNMRDFVSVREPDLTSMEVFGNYRVIVDGGGGRDSDEDGVDGMLSNLHSSLEEIAEPDSTNNYPAAVRDEWEERLTSEYDRLLAARGVTGWEHRLRVGFGDRFGAGVRLSRGSNSLAGYGLFADLDLGTVSEDFDVAKTFATINYLGAIDKIILGNYHLALGQGLMMDNVDDLIYRSTYRTWGLHPDLTPTRQFALFGGAAKVTVGPFLGYGFFSYAGRDAFTSIDGTPNVLTMSSLRTSEYADVLTETTYGGYGFFDLGGFLPIGTAIGIGAMNIAWSDSLIPDAEEIDIPDDASPWDCPEYDALPTGNTRSFVSASAQTVYDNMSIEGEIVRQDNGAFAGLARAKWQNDYFYLLGIYRRYDLGYSNPYNRGFAEQIRYDDTVFEKPYYLFDPMYSQLAEWPTPKPEEGIYLESRFQLSKEVTITKVYLDLWRSLGYDFNNYRFQGEVEYRPDFPVRFRLKYKYQAKTKMHEVIPTTSRTSEFTFRSFFLASASDYFDVTLRYGMVNLTPNPRYGDDRLMAGGFISMKWEHNFTDALSVLGGSTLWTTDGMSQWEFEDTGIDFLDGDGTKFYMTIRNNLSDNLQLRFKVLRKDTFYPRTDLYRPDPDYHYQGDPDGWMRMEDFTDHVTSYGIRCQLDFRW